MKSYILLVLLLICSGQVFSQVDYDFRRKKIRIQPIDTSELFIYENNQMKLCFSQNDIAEYLINLNKENEDIYQSFIDTLEQNSKVIEIKADTIYDKVYEFDRGNGMIEKGEFPSGNDKRDYLSGTFYFVAVDLILQGKVLIRLKGEKLYFKDYIIAKKVKGILGNEYLVFKLSNGIEIYQIQTGFGL